jgi:hypothetical protein
MTIFVIVALTPTTAGTFHLQVITGAIGTVHRVSIDVLPFGGPYACMYHSLEIESAKLNSLHPRSVYITAPSSCCLLGNDSLLPLIDVDDHDELLQNVLIKRRHVICQPKKISSSRSKKSADARAFRHAFKFRCAVQTKDQVLLPSFCQMVTA